MIKIIFAIILLFTSHLFASCMDPLTTIYLNSLPRKGPLPREEEQRLAQVIQEKGEEAEQAKKTLVERNLRLVPYIARKFTRFRKVELLELIQEGNIGLVTSTSYFKPLGKPFYVYACPCIYRRMHKLVKQHFKNPIDQIDYPMEELEAASEDYLEDAIQKEDETLLSPALDKLTPRHRMVVHHRFGLNGETKKTLAELSQMLGVSRERVRQIEAIAFRELANSMEN